MPLDRFSSIKSSLSPKGRRKLVGAIFVLSILVGSSLMRYMGYVEADLYQPDWGGSWISADGKPLPKAYYRKVFEVSGNIKAAWIQLAVDNEYHLFINGRKIANNQHLASNLNAFQSNQSEAGQRVGLEHEFRIGANPNMQWAASEEWRIAQLYDIRPFVTTGRNVIAVFAQSNSATPKLILDGKVILEDGKELSLSSNESWKVHPVEEYENGISWNEAMFPEKNWRHVGYADTDRDLPLVVIDPAAYKTPMEGRWLGSVGTPSQHAFFRQVFQVSEVPRDAWIRVLSNNTYDLFINNKRVDLGKTTHSLRHRKDILLINPRPLLRKGENVIAIHLHPTIDINKNLSLSRVYVDGQISYRNGTMLNLDSNTNWVTSTAYEQGWTRLSFDHSHWTDANRLVFDESTNKKLKKYYGVITDYLTPWIVSFRYALALFPALLLVFLLLHNGLVKRVGGTRKTAEEMVLHSLMPGIILLVVVFLLDHRFGASQTKLLFSNPALWMAAITASFVLVGGLLYVAWYRHNTVNSSNHQPPSALVPAFNRWFGATNGPQEPYLVLNRVLALLTLVLGAYLLFYKLGFQWLQNDEAVSMSAAMGIHGRGAPEYPSGVWYTRSPLYHYILSLVLYVFGVSAETARLPGAVVGVVFLAVVYKVALYLSGRRLVALLCMFLLAISPWEIFMARTTRFYFLMQFFMFLAIYNFIRGFIREHNKKYQTRFFIFYTLAFLSQEVSVFLLPSFLAGYLLFSQPFVWNRDKGIVWGLLAFFIIAAVDIMTFQIRCLTNLSGISAGTGSIISIHLIDLFGFLNNMFIGQERSATLLAIVFFLGMPLWVRKRDATMAFLYVTVFITLIIATMLVLQVRPRYVYSIYPIFIYICCASLIELIFPRKRGYALAGFGGTSVAGLSRVASFLVVTAALIWSYQPIRLLKSYDKAVNLAETEALRYASEHFQEGDIILTAHPQGGVLYDQKIDYFLVGMIAFDEVFRHRGVLIDRWGGGRLINSTDKLVQSLNQVERAWIVIGDRKLVGLEEGAKEFIKHNTRAVYQPFYANVFLWEKSKMEQLVPRTYQREKNLF